MKNERCINVVQNHCHSKSNVYFKCKLICVLCIIGQCEYNTSNSNKSGHIHALIQICGLHKVSIPVDIFT